MGAGIEIDLGVILRLMDGTTGAIAVAAGTRVATMEFIACAEGLILLAHHRPLC